MKSSRAGILSTFLLFSVLLRSPNSTGGALVQFQTPIGNFAIELYDSDKPVTTRNFLNYVTNGLYQNSFMHRLEPAFVIQGGGFYVANRRATNQSVAAIQTFPPITNEFNVGKFYSNTFGTIAMAKTSDPNSATSQFFFNLNDNAPSLDSTNNSGGFTVFGHVIAGTNALNAFTLFKTTSPTNSIVNAGASPFPLSELPVLSTNISFNALIYTAIFTFQQPQLRIAPLTNGVLQLSWNSNSNLLYHVEMSTNAPSVWHEIGTASGPESTLSFLATNRISGATLYRLRLAY